MKFVSIVPWVLLLLFNNVLKTRANSENLLFEESRTRLQRLKSKAISHYHIQKQKAWTQCSNQPQTVPVFHQPGRQDGPTDLTLPQFGSNRVRRTVSSYKDTNFAILLSRSRGHYNGGNDHKTPEHQFTISIWCKPEGGQVSPAIILEAVDSCIPFPDRGWVLGIRTADIQGVNDARIYFSMHAWSKRKPTILISPTSFFARTWIHIAVTYDGKDVSLYLNGAQVAVTNEQASSRPTFSICRTLWMGGNTGGHFRGTLDELKIWNSALDPATIQRIAGGKQGPKPELEDSFSKVDAWEWAGHRGTTSKYNRPHQVPSDTPDGFEPIQAKSNPCGHTICDSPDIVNIYKNQSALRKPKVLRYRIIVVTDNDGTNPTVTKTQIRMQHDFLQKAFKPYNISWEQDESIVRNSSLRRRSVLLNCNANMVGNGICDLECKQPATGNDGGDCEGTGSFRRQNHLLYDDNVEDECCSSDLIGNGECDDICNVKAYDFDNGDCCLTQNMNCFDPTSPNRSYLDVTEFKSLLQLNDNKYINVFFAHWSRRDTLGVATFPWQKDILGEQGGVILQPLGYGVPGQMTTLVHELGHVLGLWHVHRGVTEIDCGHPCYEKKSSMTHGDLCEDTEPTPENFHCFDLQNSTQAVCGKSKFVATPYTNYMGYADDTCAEEFTSDQMARMHCYIDLKYNSVLKKGRSIKPPPPSLLTVISSTKSSVTLSWLPPISTVDFYDTNICSSCSDILEFSQYGYKAESNAIFGITDSMFSPAEATGPPDAEPCVMSHRLWLPDEKDCLEDICTLTIHFKTPVIPSLLQIWASWVANKELQDIELEFQDGTRDIISHLVAQCDMPLSLPVFYDKALTKIHIHTEPMIIGIDAVQVVSVHSNLQCSPCKPLRYRISRNPPFENGRTKEVDYPIFTDTNLQKKRTYEYRVQAWLGGKITEYSSPLVFSFGSPMCGNGVIDLNETCDDGNIRDHDGCSSACDKEALFNCYGEPSVCYKHEGDGRCEDFEQKTSVSDCGFFTPKGFTDQWSNETQAGPSWLLSSYEFENIVGPPILPLNCQSRLSTDSFWSSQEHSEFWLYARFPKPIIATSVVIYLASDGAQYSPKATLRLQDSKGIQHYEKNFKFSCENIPQEIPITKDLSLPFTKTASLNISFSNENIAISALRLRSSDILNPTDIAQCSVGQLYHPQLQKCHQYCEMEECPPLQVKHAKLTCTGHREGDICEIQCDPGYRRQETLNSTVCLAGQWYGPEPSCKPVDCDLPLLAHADVNCPDGTTYGRICSFKCLKPARFNSTSHSLATLECKENGLWSIPNQTCQLTCSLPTLEAHTTLVSSKCKKNDIFSFGESCRFLCKVGYHVEGYKIRKRYLRLQCDLTGSWSGPKCVPVTCPSIGHTSFSCTSGNTAGSRCDVTCPKGFLKKITTVHHCQLDGSWNPPLPECKQV